MIWKGTLTMPSDQQYSLGDETFIQSLDSGIFNSSLIELKHGFRIGDLVVDLEEAGIKTKLE